MAEPEARQFNSLAERIAALKAQQQVDASSSHGPEVLIVKKRPPPPPPPPPPTIRSQTAPPQTPLRPTTSPATPPSRPVPPPPPPPNASATAGESPPPLPRRTPTSPPRLSHRASSSSLALPAPSPALPPRRPSVQSLRNGDSDARRNLASSEISTASAQSGGGHTAYSATSSASLNGTTTRRLPPPTFDPASLPALPPPPPRREREKQEKEAPEQEANAARSRTSTWPSPTIPEIESSPPDPSRPGLPPRLPSRLARSPAKKPVEFRKPGPGGSTPTPTGTAPRRLPPPPPGYTKSPFANGNAPPQPLADSLAGPPPPALPSLGRDLKSQPPPIPLASRPSEAEIEASAARLAVKHACLACRDFAGPDAVAVQYPRHTLPQYGVVDFLARALCDPFPSHTDKARAIFAWFHHNVSYDCEGFFSGNIRWYDPDETIRMGVAVCSGYSKTYKAIADVAGLECVVVNGHGKGIGFKGLKAGDPVPPRKVDGHAWNAVRIDGGEWKLLDACWGAGNVSGFTKQYTPAFKPIQFTAPNEVFGLKHFPENESHFFRGDGRIPAWEEYILGSSLGKSPVTIYGNASDEGIASASVQPFEGDISVCNGGLVRFQFSHVCEHWKPDTHGKGKYLFLLSIHGLDGRRPENVPFQSDGYWHWLDVKSTDLGAPGQSVSIYTLDTFDGRDGRGVTAKEYTAKRSRTAASFKGVAKWDLV